MKAYPSAAALTAPFGGRIATHRASMLDVCAALILTLAGLLGFEGATHGE